MIETLNPTPINSIRNHSSIFNTKAQIYASKFKIVQAPIVENDCGKFFVYVLD
jgi:hypothetical protein